MKKKLNKKEYLKIILFVFIVVSDVFSDWEHFKEGLLGF
jgi:hypothetical protein